MWARFMTRRDILSCPPRGEEVLVAASLISAAPEPYAGHQQYQAADTGDHAMLHVHARDPVFMPRKEARQLIRRHDKVDAGDHEQNDAEQDQYELHGASSLRRNGAILAMRPRGEASP